MGGTNSKGGERTEALRLCRERKRFIKQAIDSRYALAAAHVAYVESLKNIGVALRRYAEAEILIESSISTSATELDKTPSHSSYHPSPSPSHIGGVSDSPVLNGKSTASVCLASFRSSCWKRTTSSRSSSSRNPLNAASKDDDDSGSDFMEEFCMIAGSHSSTLDRLYAWERKLYDEVKASETIRKEYDRKCNQLRRQFAKDLSVHVIDKTRAVVKDLHSRIRVALHAVDSISKRIEKMRDDELLPQLLELIQGLIRMWKVMLECHHSQYITISLAYHSKSSTGTTAPGDAQKQIMLQLQDELEYFGLSFADWINSHTSYVEALNGWLQNCILQPQERTKNRRAFSPRRVLAPPIFVLLRDWSAGIKSLPSEELSDAIRGFLSDLRHSIRQSEEPWKKETTTPPETNNTEESSEGNKDEKNDEHDEDNRSCSSSNLSCLQTSLTKVFDRLTKFSEASLKMCEDVRQKCETARNAYQNYKPPRSYSI